MDKKERYTNKLLGIISNPDHKSVILDYLRLREKVDHVNSHTINVDVQALYKLSCFLGKKPFDQVLQDDLMEFDDWLIAHGLEEVRKEGNTLRKLYLYELFLYELFCGKVK